MREEVDAAFIQDLEHRPSPKIIDAEGIPVIDLSPLNSSTAPDAAAAALIAAEIGGACRQWGFFQVINHGVRSELLRRIEAAGKEFFAQPLEEKRKVRKDEVRVVGYSDTEHTKNVRDWKEVFDCLVGESTALPALHQAGDVEMMREVVNQWPHHPPEFRVACEEYAREVEKLSFKLLGLISVSLGLPADRLDGFFKGQHSSLLRLNHYPPCLNPDLALGVGRHKDGGALTVLSQDDVGGLEVKRKADGEWIYVKPTPDAYIINVGDIIQVWSNDAYESVEHRVKVNSEKERFSIPFFFNPGYHVDVSPLQELITDHNPRKYTEYNWGKFFATRKYGNLKKLQVENIQIHHFRVQQEA